MRRRNQRSLLALVIIGVSLALLQTPLLGTVRGWVWERWSGLIGRITGYIQVTADSQQRERSLLADNVRLQAEQHDYVRLRQQLGTPSFADYRSLPVAFVGRPLDTFHAKFLLSKGARDGLLLGAPIVVQGSTLVGFVVELKDTTAVGQLLFAPETTLPVQIEPDGAAGLVRGQHYTSLLLTTVPRDVALREQQVVVTEAKPSVLPFGLVIGNVAHIRSSENAVYQEATLTLPYAVDQLRAGVVLVP